MRHLEQDAPSAREIELVRALSHTLLLGFGNRASAVFLIAMSTVGLRSGGFPRWFAQVGDVVGIALLVAVGFSDWIIRVLPAWVALVSLYILRRERARRTTSSPPAG